MRAVRARLLVVAAAGALGACNLVLGLDDLKDRIDAGGAADGGDAGDAADAGPNCADYCTSVLKTCSFPDEQYVDRTTCLAICARFPLGDSTLQANTLLCRLTHLKGDASCGAAGPYSPSCGGEAQNFCARYMQVCGDAGGYGADCPAAFAAFPNPADAGGRFIPESDSPTRVCREYQLEAVYQSDGSLFCLEASKSSSAGFCK